MEALIVTPSQKAKHAIAGVVSYCGDYDVTFASTVAEALREICKRAFDLVIVNGDTDADAKEAALTAAAKKECGVILLVSAIRFEETVMEVAQSGVVVVPKPISRISLFSAVQTVYAGNMRVIGLKEENRDLSKKIEDLKIIDRAKIALIQRLGYTENEAHKYIEKQAMNLRTSKREIAMNVLKTYEN